MGQGSDEADAALEAGAEADSGHGGPERRSPGRSRPKAESSTATTPTIRVLVPISMTLAAGVARST